ncbi:MAG: helix-turn-helix transcriptional regulator [Paludibacteraceae bacterium]|nr:helix-turn-helix transcriptional regulator [Paludibacteraceae bacterium]
MANLSNGLILTYWLMYGLITGCMLTAGLYLLCSKTAAFSKDSNMRPAQTVRRCAGWFVLVLGVEYLFVLPFMGWYGQDIYLDIIWHKHPDAINCIGQIEALFIMPVVCMFMFSVFQDFSPIKPYHIWWSIIFPAAVLACTLIEGLIPGGNGWEVSGLMLTITHFYWFFFAITMFYLFYKYTHLFRHELEQNFSDVSRRDVLWLRFLALLILLDIVIYSVPFFVETHHVYWMILEQLYTFFMVIYITWRADQQELIIWPTSSDEQTENAEELDPILEQLGEQLKVYCEQEKPFLNPNLTRDDLVHALGTNRTYLNKYLSSQGLTFYSLVTKLRIEYACRLMEDTAVHHSLSEVALASGFRSLDVFSRQFKNIKGESPSQWGGVTFNP